MDTHQIWETALNRLQEHIYPAIFATWFAETTALSFHEGLFVVGVPTSFAKAHLEACFLEVICTTVSEIVGAPLEVRLVVAPEKRAARERSALPLNFAFQEVGSEKFLLLITQEGSCYRASVPDVPGCVAVGKTREEAVQAVREAFQAYFAMVCREQGVLPEPRTTAEYLLLPPVWSQEEGQSRTQQDIFCAVESIAHCSFCDTSHDQGAGFTVGVGGISICHACVEYCREMILEQGFLSDGHRGRTTDDACQYHERICRSVADHRSV